MDRTNSIYVITYKDFGTARTIGYVDEDTLKDYVEKHKLFETHSIQEAIEIAKIEYLKEYAKEQGFDNVAICNNIVYGTDNQNNNAPICYTIDELYPCHI